MLDLDVIIDDAIGGGRYQIILLFVILIESISVSYMNTGAVFLAAHPHTRCRIPHIENRSSFINISEDTINDIFIPIKSFTQLRDECSMKVYSQYNNNITDFQELINKTFEVVSCTDGYIYDQNLIGTSIVTEWDLVCDNEMLTALSSSSFYFGVFFGSLVGGILSDKFGRVFVYRWATLLVALCGVAVGFSSSLVWFSISRFFVGFILFIVAGAAFTYGVEISKTRWRATVGLTYNAFSGIGCIILSGIAYIWKDWRHFQFATSITGFIPLFLLSWVLPKSPRWLYSHNRLKECKDVLKKMARFNHSHIPDESWNEIDKNSLKKFETDVNAKEERRNLVKNLFRRPYTRYLICCNMFIWMVTCLLFYGIVLNGGTLPGNIYVNNAVGGVVEFCATLLGIPLINYFGCTNVTSASLFVASASCILSTIIVQFGGNIVGMQIVIIVLSMCSRFTVSLTFGTIYLHTVELFPTVARTTAFGISSMSARIGSIFSPFTNQAQFKIPWLTPVIYGILAAVGAVLASTFPDTRKSELTTTFEEAEEMFQTHLKKKCISRLFCPYRPKSKSTSMEDMPFNCSEFA